MRLAKLQFLITAESSNAFTLASPTENAVYAKT